LAYANSSHEIPVVRIGRVVKPHGIRGALRVALDNPESTTLEAVKRIFLETGGARSEYLLKGVTRAGRDAIRLELADLEGREAAEALRGAIVLIATVDLPPECPGEFYSFRAIGCEVRTLDGRSLGRVREVLATGANDVLVIRDGAAELLAPVIADVIKRIDFERQVIIIDAIPGLLD
jgi:16S rRNA processing protein RimM